MADEQQSSNGQTFPEAICEKCSARMVVIGIGTASGRLHYQCPACGHTFWGKNYAATQLGALGGKARAKVLSPERRQEIAEKAGNAFAEKMRERRRKLRG